MMKFNNKGIPIVTLNKKIDALKECLLHDHVEDGLGHLFDLLNYVAPGYKFGPFRNLEQIRKQYGSNPVEVLNERTT